MRIARRAAVSAVVLGTLAACGGGEAPEPAGAALDEVGATPGATLFQRKLGGAGDEWGLGMAVGADGSVLATSAIGGSRYTPQWLGVTLLDASGRTRWAHAAAGPGTDVEVVGVARSPLGNGFLAVNVRGGGTIDMGGGPLASGVVKLTPAGNVAWQRTAGQEVTSLAVDGHGAALLGIIDGAPRLGKVRWDGTWLWTQAVPGEPVSGRPVVAAGPGDRVLVANELTLSALPPGGGAPLWSVSMLAVAGGFEQLAVAPDGTVIAAGWFEFSITFPGEPDWTLEEWGPGPQRWVAAVSADGHPRWLSNRFGGPLAVDRAGRVLLLEQRGLPCGDTVDERALDGFDAWERPLATCPAGAEHGARGVAISAAPGGGVWVQGEADGPFDPGRGRLSPSGSDWFVARIAP
ncbi:MAG: hypothetical protein QM767_29970 [Anaeromyxobacter sp.]